LASIGAVWLALAAAMVALAGAASAHPYFLHSSPAPSAVVSAGLSQIDISYTESLDLAYCKVSLIAPDGTSIPTRQLSGSGGSELEVAPQNPLEKDGTYAVEWTAVGSDGHTVFGTFPLSIGHVSSNPDVVAGSGPNSGSTGHTSVVDEVLRAILPAATVILAGLLLLAPTLADVIATEGDETRRALVGRRLVRTEWWTWGVLLADVALLSLRAFGPGGWTAFVHSNIGRLLVAQLILVVVAALVLADNGAIRQGGRPGRVRRVLGVLSALGLALALADSGHGGSAPSSRHVTALVVYAVHLTAVALWIGAIAALVIPLARSEVGNQLYERARHLRGLVAVAMVAVLGTGLATTAWGLRSFGELVHTAYGGIITTKIVLFATMLALGVAAIIVGRRLGRRLVVMEASVAGVVLVLAGILGQLPQPIDFPLASEVYASEMGLPVQVDSATNSDLLVGMVSPAIVGENTIVAQLDSSDINDFLQPVTAVDAMTVRVSCGCNAADQLVVLHRSPGSLWWTGQTDLPVATTWSINAVVDQADPPSAPAPAPLAISMSAQVLPAHLPHQVVIGAVADLSGPVGQACQDEIVGMQTALYGANDQGYDHGDPVRVVTVDADSGVTQALASLRALHPEVVVPCGSTVTDTATVAAAKAWGVPVVAPVMPATTLPGIWTLSPSWTVEGQQLAQQAQQQGASTVTVVCGTNPIDRAELAAVTPVLARDGISYKVLPITSNAVSQANEVIGLNADAVITLAAPNEILPLIDALSNISASTGWQPSRGILASAQLMDTDFINDAGQLTRVGAMEFASDIDPFDPLSQYYASQLLDLFPGIRPTFQGLHGYDAAEIIARALDIGGGHPSTTDLTSILATHFRTITAGSYRGSWGPTGGGATALAFFRSTYINPMALPSFTPAGSQALAHEGTFLDTGGFEQVTPFRSVP
jgi:methionine-rich copper-binding protein CopC/putative copper export protein/ABC-type branched-subunit amino acid transport system substrate-binding protein